MITLPIKPMLREMNADERYLVAQAAGRMVEAYNAPFSGVTITPAMIAALRDFLDVAELHLSLTRNGLRLDAGKADETERGHDGNALTTSGEPTT